MEKDKDIKKVQLYKLYASNHYIGDVPGSTFYFVDKDDSEEVAATKIKEMLAQDPLEVIQCIEGVPPSYTGEARDQILRITRLKA